MRTTTLCRCVLVIASASASAQAPTGIPAVDSASVARAAWASAVRASRQNDVQTARAQVNRATNAWPSQPTYIWYSAIFAAQLGDTAGVRQGLTRYERLGLGRDLSDTTFNRYRSEPWFADVARAHDANRAIIAKSTPRHTLSDSTLWPEGVDHDLRTGNFYITSVRHRTLVEVRPDGRERDLWPREQAGIGAVLAARVDSRRGVIWASMSGMPQMAGYTAADSGVAALMQVRISDGAIVKRWNLAPSRHVLGDVAIGPAGDVFTSDSNEPVLYRLRPGADSLEQLRHPLFRSLQGIATTPEARVIFVADYSHGLLRVDLATPSVTRLEEPPDVTTLGCDGIVWYNGALIAIQNGVSPARVMRFGLDPSGMRIVSAEVLDRNWRIADEPTIGTIVGNEFVYVANSQWEKHTEDGRRTNGSTLARPILLAVPLRR